jgi:hypothetical protein
MRGVRGGLFFSEHLPPLLIRVAPPMRYLGSFEFELKRIAQVERHIFVETSEATVTRMLVLHFESFLPDVTDLYRYVLANPRDLGGATYGSSAGTLSLRDERAESPEGEMAHTAAFVAGHDLVLPDRHAVARYARIVGDDRRSELLIFYHEIDGAPDGILERAERAFEVTMEH